MPRKRRSVRAPAKPFPLLSLPPELRILVWRYVLVKDTTVDVFKHQRQECAGKPPPTLLQPEALLRTDKRLEFHHQRQNLAEELPPTTLRSGKRLELEKRPKLEKWPNNEDASRRKKPRTTSKLALAFTCQQIYLEATPIYYAENTFSFKIQGYGSTPTINAVTAFADAIGTVKASSVILLRLQRPIAVPLIETLAAFPGLGELQIKGLAGQWSCGKNMIWRSPKKSDQQLEALCQNRSDLYVTEYRCVHDEPTRLT